MPGRDVVDQIAGQQQMAFHDRAYGVHVVLGKTTAPLPWVQSTWGEISAVLDPLMQAARERPLVRSSQLGPRAGSHKAGSPKPGSPKQRSISFGRIGWDDRGARKWCHSVDGQLVSGDRAYFLATDVWAPSWPACVRQRVAPDVFFSINNIVLPPGHTAKFSSTCLLAVASDLGRAAQARRSAQAVATTLQAAVRGYCIRTWGRSTDGGVSFTDALSSLAVLGLFKLGPVHVQEPALSMLEGDWLSF